MKKAIIIGSNKGYGTAISKALHNNGFYTIGLSRKNTERITNETLPITDVSNNALFSSEFKTVLEKNNDIDTVVFVAGDVVLKQVDDYTKRDFKYTLDVNLGYVVEAIKKIIEKSDVKNIVTFGSQWSYKENGEILASYSVAKHLLKRFTQLLNERGINAFHFCIPTSKTEKALSIGDYLSGTKQKLPLEESKWAEPDEVAQIIVEELSNPNSENHLYKFENKEGSAWSMSALEVEMDDIDKKMQRLTLDDFFENEKLYEIAKDLYVDLVKKELLENKEESLEFKPKIV